MPIDVRRTGASTRSRAVRVPEPVVLHGVTYGEYLKLRRDEANDHLRMTDHDGTLELTPPELIHELPSRRLSVLILVLGEELGVPFLGVGSTTFHRGKAFSGLDLAPRPDPRNHRRACLPHDHGMEVG